MIEILTAIVLGLTLVLYLIRRKPKNYPPGLPNLPFVGSIPFLERDMRKNFTNLHKKFGPVFSFSIGSDNWIVICDFKLFKEAMSREEFKNRPLNVLADFSFKDKNDDVRGLMFSNDSNWQEQRRFTLRHLRDFGFGKQSMEHLIHEEINKCIKMIRSDITSSPNQKVSLQLRLNVAILNALWHIITGQKLEYDDPNLKEIITKINIMMTGTALGGPMFVFPWLKHIIPKQIGYSVAKQMFDDVYEIIEKSFVEHKETFDADNPRDFMDVFIKQMQTAEENPKSSFHGVRGKENLFAGLVNLFVGGSETTSSTLNWALFYLAKHPKMQAKAVEEIKAIVGHHRLPSLEDRSETPYVEAIVMETHRMSALAFSGIPRLVTKDTKLGDFFLPKGTQVMSGIYEIMHDPEYWKDPEVFRPERFIDATTGKVKGDERFIPFGTGTRVCIGSTLAQNELYLFLAAFLQRFQFSNPTPEEIEPVAGFVLGCPDFQMNIQEREEMIVKAA